MQRRLQPRVCSFPAAQAPRHGLPRPHQGLYAHSFRGVRGAHSHGDAAPRPDPVLHAARHRALKSKAPHPFRGAGSRKQSKQFGFVVADCGRVPPAALRWGRTHRPVHRARLRPRHRGVGSKILCRWVEHSDVSSRVRAGLSVGAVQGARAHRVQATHGPLCAQLERGYVPAVALGRGGPFNVQAPDLGVLWGRRTRSNGQMDVHPRRLLLGWPCLLFRPRPLRQPRFLVSTSGGGAPAWGL
mmetsp:Transcript_19381/g.39822  ORF Transcript_19381/g.39822 Transcript_19381/m.39822 type:complete len:242 (-) Transcript_19381:369-1094(-)